MYLGPVGPNPTTTAPRLGVVGYIEPAALFIDSAEITWLLPGHTVWPGPTGTARVRIEVEWDGPHVTVPARHSIRRARDAIGTAAVPVAEVTEDPPVDWAGDPILVPFVPPPSFALMQSVTKADALAVMQSGLP